MSIQIKRGMKKDLPQLKDGELAFCRDTKELYVGNNGNENVSVTKKIEDRLDIVDSQLEQNVISLKKIKYSSINVLDYGAKCDGVTDDTEAIQIAINMLKDGDKLVIPSNCVMNGFVEIHDKGNLTIDAPYIKGNGKFHIKSTLSEFVNIRDVSEGEYVIENNGLNGAFA